MQSLLNIVKIDDVRREAEDLTNVFTQRQNKDAGRLADEINNIVSLVSRNKTVSSNAFIFTTLGICVPIS